MEIIADLHLHSKYSRAVSPKMVIPEIARWAEIKGIGLVGTTDFTHPLWYRELKANLEEAGEGVYQLKGSKAKVKFLLTTELSSIYRQDGRLRRIHLVVLAPSFEEVEKINEALGRRGNLISDGRPIFGLSAKEMTDLILNISSEALIVPAHVWTPHFSLYGSLSGFDSIEECFGEFTKQIRAIETGLSSDPRMNWQVEELDSRTILSFSDAHSLIKMGREATVFAIKERESKRAGEQERFHYKDIKQAIINGEIAYTIEFYPEEGKYHWTGHRKCGVKHSPEETKRLGATCSVCGRRLTVGVMHRVQQLAGREVKAEDLKLKTDDFGVKRIGWQKRAPYVMLVPLIEIIAESLSSTVSSQKSLNEYEKLTSNFEGEFGVLLKTGIKEIEKVVGPEIAEGIKKVRTGDLVIAPGFDGVYGTVKIWPSFAKTSEDKPEGEKQLAMF